MLGYCRSSWLARLFWLIATTGARSIGRVIFGCSYWRCTCRRWKLIFRGNGWSRPCDLRDVTFAEIDRLISIALFEDSDQRGSVIALELVVSGEALRRFSRDQAPFRAL